MIGFQNRVVAAAPLRILLAFTACGLVVLAPPRAYSQTVSPQRSALLQIKAGLLKSIAAYDREEQNSRVILEQAENGEQQALANGDTRNAALADKAAANARQAIADAQKFRAEDELRLGAINRALRWPESKERFAVPLIIRGEVQRKGQNGWAAFDPNTPLLPGDEIRTGSDSYLELQFQDGSQLDIGPTSSFLYQEAEHHPIYDLIFGRLRSVHARAPGAVLGSNDEPRYKTLTFIIAVRGTEFVIETENDASTLAVFEGSVEVDPGAGAQKVVVEKGQQLRWHKGDSAPLPVPFDATKSIRWWE